MIHGQKNIKFDTLIHTNYSNWLIPNHLRALFCTMLQQHRNFLRTAFFWVITQRSSGNSLPTFQVFKGQGTAFLTRENGTDRLSRNVGK